MKNVKRQIALLVSILLVTSFFPSTVFSEKTGVGAESMVMAEKVFAAEADMASEKDLSGESGYSFGTDAAAGDETGGSAVEADAAAGDEAGGSAVKADAAAEDEAGRSAVKADAAAEDISAGSAGEADAAVKNETAGSVVEADAAMEDGASGAAKETDAAGAEKSLSGAEKAESRKGTDAEKAESRKGTDAERAESREGTDAERAESREGTDAERAESREGTDAEKAESREGTVTEKAESREETSAESGRSEKSGEETGIEAGPAGQETVSIPAVNAGEYTVTLKANGGGYFVDTANGGAHRDSWVHTGSSGEVIYNWSYEKPKGNPGKIFEGWSTSAGGSILSDGGYTLQGNITLYAIWKQGCAVTLNANGGFFTQDGQNVSSVVTTVEKGTNITSFSFGRIDSPTASGKRFYGYSLTAGGERIPDSGYTVNSNTLTLYAVWINTCTVIYHAGGGGYFTDEDGAGQSATYTDILDEGDTIYKHYNLLLVPYEGNTFLNWSLKEDGSMPIPDSGYTVSTGTLHIYAVWDGQIVEPQTYTFTFDPNGGHFINNQVYPVENLAPGTSFALYEKLLVEHDMGNSGKPVLDGYIFKGWSDSKTGGTLLSNTDEYTVNADTVLYAIWAEARTFTCDANGGSFEGTDLTRTYEVEINSTIRPYELFSVPEKDGAVFDGWSRTADGTDLLEEKGYPVTDSEWSGGYVLYAVWAESVTVTYDANGGAFDGGSTVHTETFRKGSTVSLYIDTEPVYEGFVFRGWSLNADGSGPIAETDTFTLDSGRTVYAVWEVKPETCIVTFDGNGGRFARTGRIYPTAKEAEIEKGANISLYDKTLYGGSDPTRSGAEFKGWAAAADSTDLIPADQAAAYKVDNDVTVYAVWETKIIFDGNGGTFAGGGTTAEEKVLLGSSTVVDLGTYAAPEKAGTAFKGWAENPEATAPMSEAEAQAYEIGGTNSNCESYLYAVWEDDNSGNLGTSTVTFDGNGGFYDRSRTKTTYTKTVQNGTVLDDLSDYEPDYYDDWEDFGGWSLTRDGEALSSDTYTVQGDVTLYAVWVGNIEEAEITLTKSSMPYTGKAQTPAVKVVYGEEDRVLTAGTDYTVSYSNNVNAGTARAVITGKGRFSGTVTKTFTITRIGQTLTLSAAASSVQAGKTTTVTAGGAKETSSYTFKSSDTSVATVTSNGAAATVTGVNKGTVTITVTTPQTTNYAKSSKTVTIQVIPPALKKPGNCRFVKWKNSSYSKCLIRWDKAQWAEGYQTLLSWTDGSHATWKTVKSSVLEQTCEVAVNHVSQFKVRAFYTVNGKTVYGPWSNVEYITPSPTKFTVKKEGSSSKTRKANISWNIIYGCNGYNVFVTTNPKGTWYWNQSTDISARSTSAVITSYRGSALKKGKKYYVRIVTRRKRNGVFCTVPMPSSDTYIGTFKF